MKYTNKLDISLPLAVWLATDDYDHNSDPLEISATGLLKPTQAIILAYRNQDTVSETDISVLIPSRVGTAIHSSIEHAWLDPQQTKETLLSLGINKNVVDRVLINPTKEELMPDTIAIYLERRTKKEIMGFVISGKFDFVLEGCVRDFKSTATYNYISGSNTETYRQQGSIYRWLNPDIITEGHMFIDYIFTDWSGPKALQDKKYPQSRVVAAKIPLMSLEETEVFVSNKLRAVKQLIDSPTVAPPPCSDEELWRKPTVYKYYRDPTKKTRSTKNFPSYQEAIERHTADGMVGEIVTVPGQVMRCRYCNVVGVCKQAESYILDGSLTL